MQTAKPFFLIVLILAGGLFASARAEETCAVTNRPCVLKLLEVEAGKIETPNWRDQTYRELAKTRAFEGDFTAALALIDKIENPDTKAMTIRGIGMAAADQKRPKADMDALFTHLRAKAEGITHPPSYAIALTYIAMAQAFSKDNEGAWKTAASMKNEALRHKAYGETAEIQAEHGDFAAAMKSIGLIESEAYRNKSYNTVSKILADQGQWEEAFQMALKNTNPYKKTQSIQYVLDKQKPREVPHQ